MTTPTNDLDGQVAIVTGGAGGIGSAIVEILARNGARVVIADVNVEGARALAERLAAAGMATTPIAVDIASLDSVRRMVDDTLATHGRIDILVNNAALDAPAGLAWEIDQAQWDRVVDVNLTGQWRCTSAVLPHMIERRRGRIVFMSSMSRQVGDIEITPAYNAAKAGLVGLTVALSVHLQGFGIRVNAIAPGATGTTGTPMNDRQRVEAEVPFGLMGPWPVAEACLYLVRSSGDYLTGAVMNVSSGQVRG